MTPADVVTSFWQCMDRNNFFAAAEWLAEDFECSWPQSGEVIKGPWNYAMINIHYPSFSPWRFRIEQMILEDNQVITDVFISDGIQQARAITISFVAHGLIAHQTEFWPESLTPAKWRDRWSGKESSRKADEALLVLERRRMCTPG
ncbi:nuclear transport factor 2 family protein [Pseudaeromonas sharmana]|uniref:Nuclear transport factor 2 family protein n=1 Tax=Pseudaeromonas sharmana TaxID=328412 RepID=A0ABV8CPI5_9GAMM